MRSIGIRRLFALALVLTAFGLSGCGGDKKEDPGVGPGTPGGKDMLQDLAELLRGTAANKQRLPTRPADADAPTFAGPYPAASAGLVNGEIVYLWGVGLGSDAGKVLAWEKQVPKEGGWVLMQDGTVKQMTADEFKAAPKAK